ncbi:MAG TPA: YhzD family protein [Cerasibacillus sp.]|uniref:YhzD family protein n=1 Tax=Cerasibacillus sp. TaxID=2498711 RepID=UPI002F402B9D
MKTYVLTVFEKDGKKLLDEKIEAKTDLEAKEIGQEKLDKEGYSEHTHRLVSPNAKLLLFHS